MRPSDQALLTVLTSDICQELSQWLEAQQALGAEFLPQWQGYQSPVLAVPTPGLIQASPSPEKQASAAMTAPSFSPASTPSQVAVPVQKQTPALATAQVQAPVLLPPKSPKAPAVAASPSVRPIATYKALRTQDNVAQEAKSPEEKRRALLLLEMRVLACRQCELGSKRRGVIFSFGPTDASIAFVFAGANPLEHDQGRILTGESVELFEKILQAISVLEPEAHKDRIYMTNVIKCAATPARKDMPRCATECLEHLREQMRLLHPKVIVVWGELAYRSMFGDKYALAQARGQTRFFEGIPTIPTHHPMELVKNPNLKVRVWGDLRIALDLLKP